MRWHPRWLVLFAVLLLTGTVLAGDWPTWRGLDRSGVSTETGLLKEWPDGGPKQLWKATKLGKGHSTPSVADGRIYVLGTRSDDEFLIALEDKDGSEAWATKIGRIGREGPPSYPGPRSTPAVDGDLIFALGSDGDLVCVEKSKGEQRWKKSFSSDFGGSRPNWAWSESPLVDGDVVVCSPGSAEASMVALNKKDGSTVWKAAISGGRAAYASPVVTEIGGVKQYVQFLSGGVVGVDAKDGKLLWKFDKTVPTGMGRGTVCTTPVVHDGVVFTAAGYGHGGGAATVTGGKDGFTAKEAYFSRDLSRREGNFVCIGDYLYGTNESGVLLCLEFKTGKKMWDNRSVGKGTVAAADGMLYVRGEGGEIALVEATSEGYKQKGRFKPPSAGGGGGGGGGFGGRGPKTWAAPVIANGKLYLRDGDQLLSFDIKAK